jgi:SsrA-binding protein
VPTFIHNRKAGFNYEILERFEAGLELLGSEVKSIRKSQAALDGAYVIIRGDEAYLVNMDIAPYQPANLKGYERNRNRKLLLTKNEVRKLAGLAKNLTIVPLLVYNKKRWIKVEIAIVRGKKKFDKRETLKRRTTDRETRREIADR